MCHCGDTTYRLRALSKRIWNDGAGVTCASCEHPPACYVMDSALTAQFARKMFDCDQSGYPPLWTLGLSLRACLKIRYAYTDRFPHYDRTDQKGVLNYQMLNEKNRAPYFMFRVQAAYAVCRLTIFHLEEWSNRK